MATESPPSGVDLPPRTPTYSRFIFRAPSSGVSLVLVLALSGLLGGLTFYPWTGWLTLAEAVLLVFVLPSAIAALGTAPLARALGGRLSMRRGVLLALTSVAVAIPLALIARLIGIVDPAAVLPAVWLVLFLQGPTLWFRHMSLFGVSNPAHGRSLPASLLQPLLSIVGLFLVAAATVTLVVGGALFLVLGFLCCALLLRAADRPLRREFGVSGVSLIRPLLDHINDRDVVATDTLERFFARFAIPADLRVTVVTFRGPATTVATIVLPTVHPGPFAALGASDLPRKVASDLGKEAGLVLVPHTPCNHDLDLPTGSQVSRVTAAARSSFQEIRAVPPTAVSTLISPHEGSFARAQLIGDTALVLVTQAPAPSDDIAFAIADRIYRKYHDSGGPEVAIIDAHNSYVEDLGDLTYGTPQAERLVADVDAAVAAARTAARPGPLEAGAAARGGYTPRTHGIGAEGIRALVLRAQAVTTAYVLIDGNNLLRGMRQPILDALRPIVDAAEVMTTDNHVVHEVDGGLNPVGERYPVDALRDDVVAVVRQALSTLTPVSVGTRTADVPNVPVLGPAWTERLLTSLGDTMSMFANAFLSSFLLLIASSIIVVFVLR